MKNSWIKRKKSPRKKLRDEIGKLHFEILKLKRGNRCEITGLVVNDLGRFHILPVGKYPELEYMDENVLLASWNLAHRHWHHDYYKAQKIEKKIKELRGEDYKDNLLMIARTCPKHGMFYLQALKVYFTQELEILQKK
jgi:hypothetical protein